jgi:sigma-B regulation protein RsbU (phosphoserine phosphatase)
MAATFELLQALLGAIFVAIGAGAVVLARLRTARADRALLSFGAFSVLYGVRALVLASPVRLGFGLADSASAWIDAPITYWILVPMGRLGEALIGPGRWSSLRWAWRITAVYATAAVLWDALAREPGAALVLNPVAVFANMAVLLAHIVPRLRAATWTREAVTLAVAATVFIIVASSETLGGVLGYRSGLEPVAMLLLMAALGNFVAAGVFAGERRLAAVTHELETARQIQQSILPREVPAVPGLRVAARYLPTGAVAGDLYDVVAVPGGALGVLVADVSGHGVPAALIASMVKIAFAAEADDAADPARVLMRMNRVLCGKFKRAFVTALYAHVDPLTRTLRAASAGHPPPLLRRADGRLETVPCRGIVLGFDAAAAYEAAGVPLASGDRILFCTDGLLEAERDDVLFGEQALPDWLQDTDRLPLELWTDALVQAARTWARAGDGALSDDLTLVVVEVE